MAITSNPSGSASLLAGIAAGDPEAWDDFVRTHAALMYRVAHRLVGEHQLAEDACQEALLLIRDHSRRFRPFGTDPDALAKAWIVRAASFAAWSVRRSQRAKVRRDARAAEENAVAEIPVAGADPALVKNLRDEIESLSPRLRDPLVLVYFSGSSQEEAASMLKISIGNLRVRLHRAIERLRQRLSPRHARLDAGAFGAALAFTDQAYSADCLGRWSHLFASPLHAAPSTAAALSTGVSIVTTMSISAALAAAVATSALFVNYGVAADTAKNPKEAKIERHGPLAGLPSAPGESVAKIKALGDGEWAALGVPQADPKWGTAPGRSWSAKMVYAPDLVGAFLNGQGQHGFIKPDGHFMDDIWFYDAMANRWICLYPGVDTVHFADNIKKGDLKVNDLGQLVDKNGDVVPMNATPGHSYQYHTYDTDEHRYCFGHGRGGIGGEQHANSQDWWKQGAPLLQSKGDKVATTPYYFNTITGKFERHALAGDPYPHEEGVVQPLNFYLPSKKLLFYYQATAKRTYLADPKTNKCWDAGSSGSGPEAMADVGACYDSKRDRLYLGRNGYAPPAKPGEGQIYIYDVKTNAWSCPADKPGASGFPSTNYGFVHYDSINDVVVVFSLSEQKGTITVWNPETGEWTPGTPIPQGVAGNVGCTHGFYSPELNAHFLYIAVDSLPNGQMFAYRYKNAKPGKK